MAKRPFKPRKTVLRGLRPSPSSFRPPDFPVTIIDEMGKILGRALEDSREPAEDEKFVISHAYKVIQFRQLEAGKEKDSLLREIMAEEEEGLRVGLSVQETRGINHYILRQAQAGQLEPFSQRLKKKMEAMEAMKVK